MNELLEEDLEVSISEKNSAVNENNNNKSLMQHSMDQLKIDIDTPTKK